MYVESILQVLAIDYQQVNVGEIHLCIELEEKKKKELETRLQEIGLGLIDSRQNQLIEKVKMLLLPLARNEVYKEEKKQKLSYYLTEKLHLDYFYLSSLFSAAEGRTIEKYFIEQRIEKVKELLTYDELTLSEIAYRLEYSSVAHLSAQFKKTTGLTPSQFKKGGQYKLKALDLV
jgi:AraC-like DNA-binding protein